MMQVRVVSDAGISEHDVAELPALREAGRGIVWVDVSAWDDETEATLEREFGFHRLALLACAQRNRVPKIHAYSDHVFIVLHSPQLGRGGHVHFVELDRFIGPDYLVTVHGPTNPEVPDAVAQFDVDAVLNRVRAGRFQPDSPFELSHAVVTSMSRRTEQFVEDLTAEVWRLEQRVTLEGHPKDPEDFLDQMFATRHGLLAVMTMAGQSAEIYRRWVTLSRYMPEDDQYLATDLVDQFERLSNLAREEREYLDGVISYYRARTDTQMLIAGERLAVIAVVTLPVTALASIFGMNLLHDVQWAGLPMSIVVIIMLLMSGSLLYWAHRKGWW